MLELNPMLGPLNVFNESLWIKYIDLAGNKNKFWDVHNFSNEVIPHY